MDVFITLICTALGVIAGRLWEQRQAEARRAKRPRPEVVTEPEPRPAPRPEPSRVSHLYQHPPGQRIQDVEIISQPMFVDPARSMTVPLQDPGHPPIQPEDHNFVQRWMRGEETI